MIDLTSTSKSYIDGKSYLVTGGTGSFGKKFIKTILEDYSAKKIIVFSRDEQKQFEMQNHSVFKKHQDKMRYFLGDIRDQERLLRAMNSGIDYVIHTAALKQVPALEYNPFEAVKTNIVGSQNVIEAAMNSGVKRVISLSTDKAAAPINLYGATKLTSDKLFQAANYYTGELDTKFSVVRYGNVMGSRGSVIPYFFAQRRTGTLSITDSHMTRFNITLLDGVKFVLACLGKMAGGELFVPKLPSYRIIDVAKAIAPTAKLDFIGIRPGEKLHEEMITVTDSRYTIEYEDYFTLFPSTGPRSDTLEKIAINTNGVLCEDKYPDGLSYSSNTNPHFLTVEEIKQLIICHVDGGSVLA